jgi:shikimate 5-dehydrogenase
MTELASQTRPTMYFVGVSTEQSAALRMFPTWAEILGLEHARLQGLDLPPNAPAERYRQLVTHIKEDPQSLGARLTAHRLNVARAAGDLFHELSDDAELCNEVSCIYKRDGRLLGHATGPEVAGRASEQFLGAYYWRQHEADVLCLGAGSAAAALATYLATRANEENRPRRLLLVDRRETRLDEAQALLEHLSLSPMKAALIHNDRPQANDRLMSMLPPHSLVVNATGLGRDIPGSPLTPAARFPQNGAAWELNERGERPFLQQARAQAAESDLRVEDGRRYFLLGWRKAVGYVFDLSIDRKTSARLAEAAEAVR